MKGKKIQKKNPVLSRNKPAQLKAASIDKWKIYFFLAVILSISFVVYLPALNNSLLAWDDNNYIRDNPLVHTIDLKAIFSQYVMGNYHPLTILVHAIEYKLFGLNPAGYHTVNLLLHLMNTALVFYAIFLLSEKHGVALIAALLFGVHPLHVESVAWAAELKDLLYTFFFLASWIFYLKYLKGFQKKFIVIAFLLFLLSLLSKAMAASLPVVLILTDYFKGRKINASSLLEKIPFFLLAITLGVVAVMAQKSSDAILDLNLFPFPQRIVFACYGFITYLVKLILPLNFSAYYPYPILPGEGIPVQYYTFILLILGLSVAVYYSLRSSKKILFGVGFFSVTVFLVLQLLPVGGAIIADRYSYIPSIGIFYLAGEGLYFLWNRKLKLVAPLLLVAFTVFFSAKTYSRCGIWINDLALWNDVISQYQTIAIAYHNRGLVALSNEESLKDFNKALELKPDHVNAYNSRGTLFMNTGRNEEALKDFSKAIEFSPLYSVLYMNRGTAFMNLNKFEEALKDYNKAIELKPDFSKAIYSRGLLSMRTGKQSQALTDYGKAIELDPGYIEAYVNRGNILRDSNKIDEALQDYKKALEINSSFPIVYFSRGTLYLNQKNYDEAINDFTRAIEFNKNYDKAYYNRGLAAYNFGKKDAACADMKQAESLGFKPATDFITQVCK